MSTPNPQDHTAAIKDALFAGKKIQAIKLYREQSGLGLREAKEAVEKMEAELRIASPTSFTSPAAGKGCLVTLLVFAAVGVAWWKMAV